MSVDELVEKVARAICLAEGNDPTSDWRASGEMVLTVALAPGEERYWTRYRETARSAILAVLEGIREPSEAMTRAPDRNVWFGQDDSDLPTVAAFWHAMIDALRASVEKEDA